ncbi:tRNA pseudouridine synthase A [Spiroplasma sp. JKS002669]|uniref:tRNA pseudouridine(38-40) synthase TruA n=1 Tax=Spiroplasma attinicola TaxID=2904537 RepID=UPI0020C0AB4D|nr:tRNA pseudouridine(38-40) synthase TruA [Spiroplasma sp. JKS002669]MCL6428955.1 tRNA pseudouridine synthase A [Spiroplasma sp. JKS002669]
MSNKKQQVKQANNQQKATTYCVWVTYDGSSFFGWAKQDNLRTIEGVITKTLSRTFNQDITIHGTSRTDKGVHAYDQVFTFSLPFMIEVEKLKIILDQHFKGAIKIKKVKIVANDYNLRDHVKNKEYRYYINCDNFDPFKINYQYQYSQKLSTWKLKKVAKLFIGEHYFYNFSGLKPTDKNDPMRTIKKIKIYRKKKTVIIAIKAKGFVRYQVRYLVAAMLDYHHDKITLSEINDYLSPKQTEKYRYPKALASGLYLYKTVLNS